MEVIDALMEYKLNELKSFFSINAEENRRYFFESCILSSLSIYALNKEKNACKENFEYLFLEDILSLLHSEVNELQIEINCPKKDNRRILEEVADVAALLSGMVANIIDSINKEK